MTILIVAARSASLRLAALYLASQGHQVYLSTGDADPSVPVTRSTGVTVRTGEGESQCWMRACSPDLSTVVATDCPISEWRTADDSAITCPPMDSARVMWQPFAAAELPAVITRLSQPSDAPLTWGSPSAA